MIPPTSPFCKSTRLISWQQCHLLSFLDTESQPQLFLTVVKIPASPFKMITLTCKLHTLLVHRNWLYPNLLIRNLLTVDCFSQPTLSTLPITLSIASGIDLENYLQCLQDRGVLAPLSRISIAELLNSDKVTPVFSIPTAEQIFKVASQIKDPEPNYVEQDSIPSTQEALGLV